MNEVMNTEGMVREWHEAEGWGVIDIPCAPGPCWAHFSVVQIDGYRRLTAGQRVHVEWRTPGQDGYPCKALHIWPISTPTDAPAAPAPGTRSTAYQSELTIDIDNGS